MATHANKPPAYSTAASGPGPRRRILRIGVLLGGKIVEERLIRDRSAVSIGQSAKNTFSVPLEHLPREWTLFAIDNQGNYRLQFAQKMDGRVSDGAQVYTFDQVKGNKATQHGDHWLMPLSDQARGKVSIGDLTLLFQFVTEPPMQPKPMLPASVRGTLAERVDPRLAVICAISIVVHFGIALAAWLHDLPRSRAMLGTRPLPMQSDKTATIDIDPATVKPIEPAPTGEQPDQAGQDKKPETKQPNKPAGGEKKPSGGGGRKASDGASLEEAQAAAAEYAIGLLGADGAAGDLERMGRTAPGGDLEKQANEVRKGGGNVKLGGGGDRTTRGSGDPRTGSGSGPKVSGPGGPTSASGPGGKDEKVPKGRIQVASKKTFDDTSLSPDAVIGKIQSVYMNGLKRCYKELLKTDPTARARVELAFTVNEKGRTTGANAKTDASSLSSCIKGQMASWTFPVPKDSGGDATEASFSVTLALQPE